MTDEEYCDNWLERLGKCLDSKDQIGRLKLLREARERPSMRLTVTALEFMLPRLDGSEAALKVARDIALKSRAIVKVDADSINVDKGGTLGLDLSSDKEIGMIPHA